MKKLISILFLSLIYFSDSVCQNIELQMKLSKNDDFGSAEEESCFGCGDCSVYCAIENEFTIISSSHLP